MARSSGPAVTDRFVPMPGARPSAARQPPLPVAETDGAEASGALLWCTGLVTGRFASLGFPIISPAHHSSKMLLLDDLITTLLWDPHAIERPPRTSDEAAQ